MIELYRFIVPVSKIINDNFGQHYKTHMGKITWLSNQFNDIFIGLSEGPGGFKIPDVEMVELGDTVHIICEVWRCVNTLFDPQNYAKTFKAPLDLLVKNAYFKDDNWKVVRGVTYMGGGRTAWGRANRDSVEDGLPEDLSPDWWKDYSDCNNDILIRILVE